MSAWYAIYCNWNDGIVVNAATADDQRVLSFASGPINSMSDAPSSPGSSGPCFGFWIWCLSV
jgi:hypothetical protein